MISPYSDRSPTSQEAILQMATSLHENHAVNILLGEYMRIMEEQLSNLYPEDYRALHNKEMRRTLQELHNQVHVSSYTSAYDSLKEMIEGHFELYSKINYECTKPLMASLNPLFRPRLLNSKGFPSGPSDLSISCTAGYKSIRNLALLSVGIVVIPLAIYFVNLTIYLFGILFTLVELLLFAIVFPFLMIVGMAFVYFELAGSINYRSDLKDSLEKYFGKRRRF